MQNIFRNLITAIILLLSVTSVCAFGDGEGMPTADSPEPVISAQMLDLSIPLRTAGSQKVERIPLFSERHAQTAVATVNGEAITLQEFAMELARMHSNMDAAAASGGRDFSETLDRLIAVKLIKQEALNIGFDRTPEVRSQLENFALKAMIQQLLTDHIKDLQVDEAAVEELYRQMALEARLLTYRILDEADASALLADVKEGGDFKELADKLVAAGKAEGGEQPEYTRLNDLLPAVAQAVYSMQPGDVSELFRADKGYMLFRFEDQRVYDDAEVRLAAANRLLQQEARTRQLAYLQSLEDKYVTFDKDAEAALDFAAIIAENPQAKGTQVFARLAADQRPLARISDGTQTVLITVAEIAKKLEESMYHGMDRVIDAKEMDKQKQLAIWNRLVAVTGRMEARNQGIDTSSALQAKLADFEERLLFDTFMARAVVPGISVREEAVRAYYDAHLEDFSSPLMLKMKSLAFTSKTSAHEALRKLQAGSDFKWVSANAMNLASADHDDLLKIDDMLLSITTLPQDLHELVEEARQGDLFLYEGPGALYSTLLVDSAYPPVAKPYQDVRQEIGRILYAEKINEALADWVGKLKDAYETENYLVQEQL
jgi:parvulin-like peptidyl-prolyl isomerase